MAYIDVRSQSQTTITVRVSGLQTAYENNDRYVEWYLDGNLKGTSTISAKVAYGGSYTFRSLTPGTRYTIDATIYFRSVDGYEVSLDSEYAYTDDYEPPEFSITNVASTSVTIKITPGDGRNFTVRVQHNGVNVVYKDYANDPELRRSNYRAFSYTVSGLSPGTLYSIDIADDKYGWVNGKDFETSARPEDWEWNPAIRIGDPVALQSGDSSALTAEQWNNFCDRINEFREYKGFADYGSFAQVGRGTTISATIVNHAVWAIGAMASGAYSLEVSAGDTITASFFNGLKNYLNSIE